MPTEMKNHKWMVLSNTTLGMLAATINASIVLISLPAIFRGIGLKPLDPGNTNILLWTIMGYMVVTSVLVVTFGRLGDMFGRARIYNLGFLIFTLASIALSFMPTGDSAALVSRRACASCRAIGGAMLTATSTAILIDVFPPQAARAGARHQHHGGDRRAVPRAGARRPAGRYRLAADLLDQRADRDRRHDLGVSAASRTSTRRTRARQARLVGQYHLRDRARAGAGRRQ